MKKYIAECIGTFVLTLLGCGTAMFLGCNTPAGVVGTAVAFGLTVIAMAYTIGAISGCHINPAITLAVARIAINSRRFGFFEIALFIRGCSRIPTVRARAQVHRKAKRRKGEGDE